MTPVVVDSNILLDAILGEAPWADWSITRLGELASQSRLVINAVIFAEVSVTFPMIEDAEAALAIALLEREPIPFEAAFLAGKVFRDYRRRGGLKRSPLPDFFIGAHAAVAGYRLLTRDGSRYRTYFPQARRHCTGLGACETPQATFTHRPVLPDLRIASQTLVVSSASRKVGEAGLPLVSPSMNSAMAWTKECS